MNFSNVIDLDNNKNEESDDESSNENVKMMNMMRMKLFSV